jgi:hypothetical protein
LHNYATMSAIVNALQSVTIQRLVLTRESHLKKNERNMLLHMVELLDPARNHRAYREAIQDHKSHAVPWLGECSSNCHCGTLITTTNSCPLARPPRRSCQLAASDRI